MCNYKENYDGTYSIVCSFGRNQIANNFTSLMVQGPNQADYLNSFLDQFPVHKIEIYNLEDRNCNCLYKEFVDLMSEKNITVSMGNCGRENLTRCVASKNLQCYVCGNSKVMKIESFSPPIPTRPPPISDEHCSLLKTCSPDSLSCITEVVKGRGLRFSYIKSCGLRSCSEEISGGNCSHYQNCTFCCDDRNGCNRNTIKQDILGYYSVKIVANLPDLHCNESVESKSSDLYNIFERVAISKIDTFLRRNRIVHHFAIENITYLKEEFYSDCNLTNPVCNIYGNLTVLIPREESYESVYNLIRYRLNNSQAFVLKEINPTKRCLEDKFKNIIWPFINHHRFNNEDGYYNVTAKVNISCTNGYIEASRLCHLYNSKGSFWGDVKYSKCIKTTTTITPSKTTTREPSTSAIPDISTTSVVSSSVSTTSIVSSSVSTTSSVSSSVSTTSSVSSSALSMTTAAPNISGTLTNLLEKSLTRENVKNTSKELFTLATQFSKFTENDLDNSLKLVDNLLEIAKTLNDTKELTEETTETLSNLMNVQPDLITTRQDSISRQFTKSENDLFEILRSQIGNNFIVHIKSENLALYVRKVNQSVDEEITLSVDNDNMQISVDNKQTSNNRMSLPIDKKNNISFINFSVKRKATFYPTKNEKVVSMILTGQYGRDPVTDLDPPVRIWLKTINKKPSFYAKSKFSCKFWDETNLFWSSQGCQLVKRSDEYILCQCNHLTSFATLFNGSGKSAVGESVLTYIGLTVSIICLLATIVTYSVFKNLRQDMPSKILLCLASTLLVSNITFVISSQYSYQVENNDALCKIFGVILHWSYLSTMCWCSIESFNLYKSCIKVLGLHVNYMLQKCCLFSWGLPFIVTVITVSVSSDNYGIIDNEELCWIRDQIASIVSYCVPMAIMLIVNIIVFVLMTRKITKSTKVRIQYHSNSSQMGITNNDRLKKYLRRGRGIFGLSVILGIGWIVGFLTMPDTGAFRKVLIYLFIILNSFQGMYLFIFFCATKPEVIDGYRRWYYHKRKNYDVQSKTTKTTSAENSNFELHRST